MKRTLYSLAMLALMMVFPSSAFAYQIVTAATHNTQIRSFGFNSGNNYQAQGFTTIGAGSVSTAAAWIGQNANPTDNIEADIFAADGSGFPTGTSLGTSGTQSLSGIAATGQLLTFTFSSPVSLSASTLYTIVIYRVSGPNSTAYPLISGDAGGSTYAGGHNGQSATINSGYTDPSGASQEDDYWEINVTPVSAAKAATRPLSRAFWWGI